MPARRGVQQRTRYSDCPKSVHLSPLPFCSLVLLKLENAPGHVTFRSVTRLKGLGTLQPRRAATWRARCRSRLKRLMAPRGSERRPDQVETEMISDAPGTARERVCVADGVFKVD